SPVKGNGSQWHFSDYRGEVNPHINLRANYIKIADATTPGSVKAIATITFSYQ
ncbi:TPA: fimbrial protein, partial [Escherichia coli]|nr:fimbrial protein [Escherichia coli]